LTETKTSNNQQNHHQIKISSAPQSPPSAMNDCDVTDVTCIKMIGR